MDYEVDVVPAVDEDHGRRLAIALNTARRHLSVEDRRAKHGELKRLMMTNEQLTGEQLRVT